MKHKRGQSTKPKNKPSPEMTKALAMPKSARAHKRNYSQIKHADHRWSDADIKAIGTY